jgi:hypothetical protein
MTVILVMSCGRFFCESFWTEFDRFTDGQAGTHVPIAVLKHCQASGTA